MRSRRKRRARSEADPARGAGARPPLARRRAVRLACGPALGRPMRDDPAPGTTTGAHAPPAGIATVAPGGAPLWVRRLRPTTSTTAFRSRAWPVRSSWSSPTPGCMSGATPSVTASCGSTRRPGCPRSPATWERGRSGCRTGWTGAAPACDRPDRARPLAGVRTAAAAAPGKAHTVTNPDRRRREVLRWGIDRMDLAAACRASCATGRAGRHEGTSMQKEGPWWPQR